SPHDNRVLAFPVSPAIGGVARNAFGQVDFTTISANAGVFPQASPNSLSGPGGGQVDANGNVYVAGSGNKRVRQYATGSKTASRVWGQNDFVANGANQVKPASINSPFKIAIDYSATPYALYVSDTLNNRVLIWRDSVRFRNGDPADLVI